MEADERRVHARVEVNFPCTVMAATGRHHGNLRDLSKGGMLVEARAGMAEVGESLEVELPVTDGDEPILVIAEVRRVLETADPALKGYGLRLVIVEPKQRDELRTLIESLVGGPGVGARKSRRVARRLEVTCHSQAEAKAVMENLSKGGMALTCDTPLVLEEPITIVVKMDELPRDIEVKGRVVHVRETETGFHAGVQFEPMAEEQKQILLELIALLLDESWG